MDTDRTITVWRDWPKDVWLAQIEGVEGVWPTPYRSQAPFEMVARLLHERNVGVKITWDHAHER